MAKWKTRRTQNPLGESPWGFESPSRYQRVARGDTTQFVTAELQTYQQHHGSNPDRIRRSHYRAAQSPSYRLDLPDPNGTTPRQTDRGEGSSVPPSGRFESGSANLESEEDQLLAGWSPLGNAAAISLAHASMSSQSRKSPSSARTARMIALSAKLSLLRSSAPAKTR